MARILILGAYGLLGSSLCPHLERLGHTVLRQGRNIGAEISIVPSDPSALVNALMEYSVEVIINLIAITNVDLCETNVNQAYRANVKVVESISHAMSNFLIGSRPHLICISTDHLYGGEGPHKEDAVNPCNVYALSKLTGEFVAIPFGATILRTNFIGRSNCPGRTSLTDWIVTSLQEGRKITVFEDVLISSLHISILCAAIELVVRERKSGVYNLGSKGGDSKAGLAFSLAKRLGLNHSLMSIGRLQDIKQNVCRPLDMRMDSTRFGNYFNFNIPSFGSQVELVEKDYYNE